MFLIRKSYWGMDDFKLINIVKYDSSNGQIFNEKQMIRILMRKNHQIIGEYLKMIYYLVRKTYWKNDKLKWLNR